jgi:tryptophanyl-tRNA synthetase
MDEAKKIVFSGVQPTGKITLGNYLGAIRNWTPMQEEFDCVFCVVDLHSLTVTQIPAELRSNTTNLVALYLACGIDPTKSKLFIQSHVSAHTELTWILDTVSYVGEMNRMTQFKEKSKKHADNINMGLMNYPVLMAADILLYQAAVVPVGVDQKQHLELARDLAIRFNNRYSPTFVVPDPYISKAGSKIMSLADPSAKMSKSDPNENAVIYLQDDADAIRRKFKRAVTDSDSEIRHSADKPAISNLLTIYSLTSGVSIKSAEKQFSGVGYADFKMAVADSVIAAISPIQQQQQRILADKEYIAKVLKDGADGAEYLANKTLAKVYKKVGLVPRYR